MAAVGVEPVDTIGPPGGGQGGWFRRRFGRSEKTPYLLLLPMLAVLVLTLGLPLYNIITLSFHHQTRRELYQNLPADWVGLQNYTSFLKDGVFWAVVERTFVITVIMVVLSISISLGMALLLNRVSKPVRMVFMALLMFIWAVPQIVAVEIFQWFADPNFGILNYVLDHMLGFHSFAKHNWFADPHQGWILIIACVVWGALPFLTVTLAAGMSMVPKELGEAARMDGANPVQAFKAVTFPILKPLLIIVTSLSVVWDFQIFSQVYAMRNSAPEPGYQTLGTYAYQQAFGQSDYGLGAALSVFTVLVMLGMMVFYVRQMLRIGDGD